MIGLESGRTTATACPCDHDPSTWSCQCHRLGEGGRCLRCDVDDDVREATCRSLECDRRVVLGHIDGEIDTESMSDVESVTIARAETSQGHERRPRLFRGNGGAETADAGAEEAAEAAGARGRR